MGFIVIYFTNFVAASTSVTNLKELVDDAMDIKLQPLGTDFSVNFHGNYGGVGGI
jgi:hypothetical protein